jgi:beta-glucanase (GH16 family)
MSGTPIDDALAGLRGDAERATTGTPLQAAFGTVETFYPVEAEGDSSVPRADVLNKTSGGIETQCPILTTSPGATAGLPEGTDVILVRLGVLGWYILGPRYTEENPSPLVADNQTRIRRGEMTFEFDTDDEGRGVIRVGHQSSDGEDHDNAFLVRSDGSIEGYSSANTGFCFKSDGTYYYSGMGSYLASGTTGTGGPGGTSGTGGTESGTVPSGSDTPPGSPLGQNEADWDGVLADEFGDTPTTATTAATEFESSAVDGLDTNIWSPGFGWGKTTTASAERIDESMITIRNGTLVLTADPNGGDVIAGCVSSQGKAAFGPGTYFESRIKLPMREGFLPAFWSKPDSEAWPPEIDFVELLGNNTDTSSHHVHYVQGGGSPGGSHVDYCNGCQYSPGYDFTQDYHVFGCHWASNAIRFYVDGQQVHEVTDGNVLESCRKGAPFYMMLNIHIDKVGTTDKSVDWSEEMLVDWVRIYQEAGG